MANFGQAIDGGAYRARSTAILRIRGEQRKEGLLWSLSLEKGGCEGMQLFLNKKEALVAERALELFVRLANARDAETAQALLERIALCLEKQKR